MSLLLSAAALLGVVAFVRPGAGEFVRVVAVLANVATHSVRCREVVALDFQAGPSNALLLYVVDVSTGRRGMLYTLNLTRLAYLPVATVLALSFAAPVRQWTRALGAGALGIGLVSLLVAVAVGAHILGVLEDTYFVDLSSSARFAVKVVSWTLNSSGVAFAICLWVLARWIVNRRGDWLTLSDIKMGALS